MADKGRNLFGGLPIPYSYFDEDERRKRREREKVLDEEYRRDPPPKPEPVPKKSAKELYLSRPFDQIKENTMAISSLTVTVPGPDLRQPQLSRTDSPGVTHNTKAIVRDGIYIWIAKGSISGNGSRATRYFVRTYDNGRKEKTAKHFEYQRDAIEYANGLSTTQGALLGEEVRKQSLRRSGGDPVSKGTRRR